VEQPEVRYARSGDVAIAYYVVGEGPRDLVFVPFTVSMVFAWHLPVFRDFCLRLSPFSRLILFDKRGIGASDRPRTPPTLESQMEDVRAVLDAVGSEQAALFGSGHGGQMCALFARHVSGADDGARPLRHASSRSRHARRTSGRSSAHSQ
jgi:pimeloyl-ACP methyl ester carboxylesterase